MSRRDDQRIAKARQALLALLTDADPFLPGGIVDRTMRCGKPNCRCNTDPAQLHGPYHQWGYSKGGHRYTRRLSDSQLERYEPQINRGRRLMELLAELDDAQVSRVERAEGWGA